MHRPSWFAAFGGALAALSLAGIWWVGFEAGLTLADIVRLGNTGVVAAAIGWAALAARQPVIAASRAVIVLGLYATSVLGSAAVYEHRADPETRATDTSSVGEGRSDRFDPVADLNHIQITIDWSEVVQRLLVDGGVVLVAAGAAVLAVRAARRLRAPLTVVAVLPVVYEAVSLASGGAQVGAVLGVAATGWLVWAIRRAAREGPPSRQTLPAR